MQSGLCKEVDKWIEMKQQAVVEGKNHNVKSLRDGPGKVWADFRGPSQFRLASGGWGKRTVTTRTVQGGRCEGPLTAQHAEGLTRPAQV